MSRCPYEVFLGSFDRTEKAAIMRCLFDPETGKMTETERFYTVRPSYLCFGENPNILFCIREAAEIAGIRGGGVESIDISGKKMQSVSKTSTLACGPSHLCYQDGFLLVSIYGDGALTQFRVNQGSEILPASRYIQHQGHGRNPDRQEGPHAHFVCFTPDKQNLAVCDLGLDRILMYPWNPETGVSLEATELEAPAGSGPRHLLFSRDGRMMYVLTEMGGTVLVYKKEEKWELIQEISSLTGNENVENASAAIRFSPDYREIAVSNRGTDHIVFFAIEENGLLRYEGAVKTGLWPRDFAFSPDGNWLLCADQNENCIEVFRFLNNCELSISERVIRQDELTFPADIMPCCILFRTSE